MINSTLYRSLYLKNEPLFKKNAMLGNALVNLGGFETRWNNVPHDEIELMLHGLFRAPKLMILDDGKVLRLSDLKHASVFIEGIQDVKGNYRKLPEFESQHIPIHISEVKKFFISDFKLHFDEETVSLRYWWANHCKYPGTAKNRTFNGCWVVEKVDDAFRDSVPKDIHYTIRQIIFQPIFRDDYRKEVIQEGFTVVK
jgi:hypothetical protein